jgi:hypothetical protein
MSNELTVTYTGGNNVYCIIRKQSNLKVWNAVASVWVTWADGDIANYPVAMADAGGDYYTGDAPSQLADDTEYRFIYYERVGAAPTITDLVLGSEEGTWTGETLTNPPDESPVVYVPVANCVSEGDTDDAGGLSGDLSVRVPTIATEYDSKLWRQKRAVLVDQGTCSYLQLTIRDGSGQGVNLLTYGLCNNDPDSVVTSSSSSSAACTGQIKARWREASLVDTNLYQTQPTIIDATRGIVRSIIPSQITDKTGIYLAQLAILNDDDCPLFMDDCYVYVEHSAWYGTDRQTGPPILDDIRLSLRDSDPALNELIDSYDFNDGEIAFAAVRVVQFWNDQPPTISGARFSTKNFPFREIWLEGIQLNLFELIEEYYRRNFMQVSAGGTVTDDKNRFTQYNAAWKERFQRFQEGVMHQKAQINLRRGYGWLSAR